MKRKIIFMGTPAFAVPSLKALIASDNEVVAVFTQAPKAAGRGMKIVKSPVQLVAEAAGIAVYSPATLRTLESQAVIAAIEADVIVVVAYGFIIPKAILDSKKYGCLNIHPSLLPRFRGAAPLQRTIMAGDKETAVCIMQMDEGLDTGDIILQKKFSLPERITLPELHDICADLGGRLLLQALAHLDSLPRLKQSEEGVVYAAKLTKEEGLVNWQNAAIIIDQQVRATNPWPGSYFIFSGTVIKILSATPLTTSHDSPPGTVLDDKLTIACGQGSLRILELQKPGKSPMSTAEFLRGLNIPKNTLL